MQQAFDEYAAAHNADRPVVDATVPATDAGVPLPLQTVIDIGRRCRRKLAVTAMVNLDERNVETVTLLRSSPNRDRIVLSLQNQPSKTGPAGPIFEIRITEPSLIVPVDDAWHDATNPTAGFDKQLARVVAGRSIELAVRGTPSEVVLLLATFQQAIDASCVVRVDAAN